MFAASKSGSADAKDAQFNYVTMLLHGNGTNGAQNNTFLDSSTNNFTITRNGNTTQGTFTPYGNNWSNYFDGSGDYLTAGSSISLSGDFTVEGWVYRSSSSGNGTYLLGLGNDYYSTGATFFVDPSTGYLRIYTGQAHLLAGTSGSVSLNTWSHVAFVRSSNTLKAYVNGVQVDSASWSATISGTAYINAELNGNPTATVYVGSAGYLSNLRVNTTAVYTTAFTPSTAPLPAITGTQLLTCQSNRFVDNSTNAYTITKTGDTSVQRFSPFSPTTAYSTSVIGGSGYFDGSGDYLSYSETSALNAGTGDFTVECWVYHLTSGALQGYLYNSNPSTGGGINFRRTSSNTLQLSHDGVADVLTTTATIPISAWTHVAVTRNSGTVRLFINGVVGATATYTGNFTNTLATGNIGAINGSYTWNGYMTDMRYIVGTALYTSAFTPPTAPLTAVTNTQLLTNFTNAGILDNAMMNDLETVGNAQISTSVKKYGTGSMYFDGTGDSVNAIDSPQVQLGSGNFTIEFWAYFNTLSGNKWILGKGDAATAAGSSISFPVNGVGTTFDFYYGSSTLSVTRPTFSTATWYHVAVVRNGATVTLYINGTSSASANFPSSTTSINTGGTNPLKIGEYAGGCIDGYIDDLRITKGVARYTTTFTPPTAAFPDKG